MIILLDTTPVSADSGQYLLCGCIIFIHRWYPVMLSVSINASGISKKFNGRIIFSGIDLCVSPSNPLVISGPNGSGKSTLLEIIAGIRRPSSGQIVYQQNGIMIASNFDHLLGFASPRLHFYDELTAHETITFIARDNAAVKRGFLLLERFSLTKQHTLQIGQFSTGMVQRLKIIAALINDPPVLLLDEPSSNLDDTGRRAVFSIIEESIPQKTVIIATNDKEEASLCSGRILLGA